MRRRNETEPSGFGANCGRRNQDGALFAEHSGRPEDSNAIDAGHHADVDRLSGRQCISTGGSAGAGCAISMAKYKGRRYAVGNRYTVGNRYAPKQKSRALPGLIDLLRRTKKRPYSANSRRFPACFPSPQNRPLLYRARGSKRPIPKNRRENTLRSTT